MNSEVLDSRVELIKRCRDPEDVRLHILRSLDDTIRSLRDEVVSRTKRMDKQIDSIKGKTKEEVIIAKLGSQRGTKNYVDKLKQQRIEWEGRINYGLHEDNTVHCVGGYCMYNPLLDWRDTLVQGRRSGPIIIVDSFQDLKDIGDEVVYVFMCGFESTGHSVYFTKKDPVKKVNVIYYMQKTGVEIDENLQIDDENYEDPRIKLVIIDDLGKDPGDYGPLKGSLLTPYRRARGKPFNVRSDAWLYLRDKPRKDKPPLKRPFIQLYDMFEYEKLLKK
jgi:hypothetical protein